VTVRQDSLLYTKTNASEYSKVRCQVQHWVSHSCAEEIWIFCNVIYFWLCSIFLKTPEKSTYMKQNFESHKHWSPVQHELVGMSIVNIQCPLSGHHVKFRMEKVASGHGFLKVLTVFPYKYLSTNAPPSFQFPYSTYRDKKAKSWSLHNQWFFGNRGTSDRKLLSLLQSWKWEGIIFFMFVSRAPATIPAILTEQHALQHALLLSSEVNKLRRRSYLWATL